MVTNGLCNRRHPPKKRDMLLHTSSRRSCYYATLGPGLPASLDLKYDPRLQSTGCSACAHTADPDFIATLHVLSLQIPDPWLLHIYPYLRHQRHHCYGLASTPDPRATTATHTHTHALDPASVATWYTFTSPATEPLPVWASQCQDSTATVTL